MRKRAKFGLGRYQLARLKSLLSRRHQLLVPDEDKMAEKGARLISNKALPDSLKKIQTPKKYQSHCTTLQASIGKQSQKTAKSENR
jgi:hypothetical protein